MDTLRLPAKIESLERLRSHVLQKVEHLGVSEDTLFKIELILEELLINIINYAYPEGGEGDVEIGYSLDNDRKLLVSIRDWGCPFDPVSRKDPNTCQELDERQIGGLGIYLARKFVTELTYERESGRNNLTFCFEL